MPSENDVVASGQCELCYLLDEGNVVAICSVLLPEDEAPKIVLLDNSDFAR